MDPFASEKQALREHPTYVQACRTPPCMWRRPAHWLNNRAIQDSVRLQEAALKMDHMFRGALACDYHGAMASHLVSAIEAFITYIERTMPTMSYNMEARAAIQQRIDFGKLIIDLRRREYASRGWDQAIGGQWFKNLVVRCGYTMQNVVYENLFRYLYHSNGSYSGASTDLQLLDFHSEMLSFYR